MPTVVDLITQEAARQGVDPNLAVAVANAESSLDPNTADSPAGAIGLFQLEPATAAQLGVNPRDVTQNIRGGIMYLGAMLGKFGSVPAALAAYNWGPGRLAAAIAQWGAEWIHHLPSETANYIAKIMRALGQYPAAVTPASVATPSPAAPGDDNQTAVVPAPSGSSLTGVWILAGLGVGVYILAEVFLND